MSCVVLTAVRTVGQTEEGKSPVETHVPNGHPSESIYPTTEKKTLSIARQTPTWRHEHTFVSEQERCCAKDAAASAKSPRQREPELAHG